MKSKKNSQQKLSKALEDLNVKNVDSFMKFFSGNVEQLIKKAGMCPKVDEKGRSECPFADQLYAQKEEMEKKVVNGLTKLGRYRELVDKEIKRFHGNLNQIRSNANRLHSKQAKEKYTNANVACASQIEKNRQRQKALLDLNLRAKKALNLARSKKWPVQKPKKKYRSRSARTSRSPIVASKGFKNPASISPSTPLPRLESAISNLMSIGPLSKSTKK